MANIISISLPEEYQDVLERNEELIEEVYGGKSELFQDKLKEIDKKRPVETRLEKKRRTIFSNLAENIKLSRDISRLERRLQEKEIKEEINEKKKSLNTAKQELENVKSKSEQEIRDEIYRKAVESGRDVENNPELRQNIEDRIERRLQQRVEKIQDKEDTVEELQSEVDELRSKLND